jgi:tetratricopeptide (TPR) repeat protein
MKTQIAVAVHHLARVSHYQGEFAKALSQYDEALALSQTEEIPLLLSKGFVSLRLGDRTRSLQLIEQGLLLSREAESSYLVAIALIGLAGLSASEAGRHRAARLLGAAEALLESSWHTISVFPARHAEYKRIKAMVREQLDEGDFNRLAAEGRAMVAEGLDRVVEYDLEGR